MGREREGRGEKIAREDDSNREKVKDERREGARGEGKGRKRERERGGGGGRDKRGDT